MHQARTKSLTQVWTWYACTFTSISILCENLAIYYTVIHEPITLLLKLFTDCISVNCLQNIAGSNAIDEACGGPDSNCTFHSDFSSLSQLAHTLQSPSRNGSHTNIYPAIGPLFFMVELYFLISHFFFYSRSNIWN